MGAVHGLVLAEPESGGDGDRGPSDGGDDPVLAGHVVRGRQHRAERGTPEHVAPPGRIGQLVGEVRVAAGDQLEGERRGHAADRGDQPLGDPSPVDSPHLDFRARQSPSAEIAALPQHRVSRGKSAAAARDRLSRPRERARPLSLDGDDELVYPCLRWRTGRTHDSSSYSACSLAGREGASVLSKSH